MAEAIQIESLTLKCDAAGCGYAEPHKAMTADLIGKPCPKCGANLLTEKDYLDAKFVERAAELMNELIGPIEPSGNVVPVSVNPHAGDWNIKLRGEHE